MTEADLLEQETNHCHRVSLRQPSSLHYLRILNDSDLQRELRAFMFFSEDQGDQHSRFCPPDLRSMICLRDVKLPD